MRTIVLTTILIETSCHVPLTASRGKNLPYMTERDREEEVLFSRIFRRRNWKNTMQRSGPVHCIVVNLKRRDSLTGL